MPDPFDAEHPDEVTRAARAASDPTALGGDFHLHRGAAGKLVPHSHPHAAGHALSAWHPLEGQPNVPGEASPEDVARQRAVLAGWTRHGYAIPGVAQVARYQPPRQRCMGTRGCATCVADVELARAHRLHELPPAEAEHQAMLTDNAEVLRQEMATPLSFPKVQLRASLESVLEHLGQQETAIVQEAHTRGINPTEMRDTSGGYLLAPVLVAQAHALAALAALRS